MHRKPKCCIMEESAARAKEEIPEHRRDESWALRELMSRRVSRRD